MLLFSDILHPWLTVLSGPGLEHVTVIASVRATSGLVTGRIKLNAWATNQKERIDSMAGISILKNCVLCLLNGALGQRGLLMQRIQIHNIAIRCTGMTVDFSVSTSFSSALLHGLTSRGRNRFGCLPSSLRPTKRTRSTRGVSRRRWPGFPQRRSASTFRFSFFKVKTTRNTPSQIQ